MPRIELTNVTKRWGNYFAVDNLNLVIEDNSFITLLGPSGCGKTTTLRMIAGLETPTSGKITIGGVTVFDSKEGINIPANKRRVGFLFQNYALWPNMTVYNNIAFGLKNIKEKMPTIDYEAKNNARLLEILANYNQIITIINDCKDNKSNIDYAKAMIKLIDFFEISMLTAKTIFGFGLHSASNPKEVAEKLTNDYKNALSDIHKKYETKGLSLNENFEVVKDGKVVTSVRKLTAEEIDLRVRRVSRVVKIGEFMGRYPSELSGGQQQRVAIARTLAPEPVVLFMDEPLSNLDAKLRLEMRSELQRLHIDTGSTFVYVTHDQLEAMTLATKICLINNGVLQQYEAPLDVYKKPVNLFVADFVGNPSINFIEAKGSQNLDGSFELTIFDDYQVSFIPNNKLDLDKWHQEYELKVNEEFKIEAENKKLKSYVEKNNRDLPFKYRIAKINDEINIHESSAITNNDFVIGVRPEFIKFTSNGTGTIKGQIYSAMPAGMETTVKINVGNYLLTGVIFGGVVYTIGENISLDFTGNEVLIFDRASGKLISQGSIKIK